MANVAVKPVTSAQQPPNGRIMHACIAACRHLLSTNMQSRILANTETRVLIFSIHTILGQSYLVLGASCG